MKLRLYHHHDGARVAYREAGTGPPLALLHSAGLSHREFEPLVEHLSDRFRLVLPDLPLHGDSEDRPRHPYSLEWLVEVIAGFCRETCGSRPRVGGHGAGAELLLRATIGGQLEPSRLVLMPNRMHGPARGGVGARLGRSLVGVAALPGLDRALSHAAAIAAQPERATRFTARDVPEARDLVRHAIADLAGNGNRARSWARLARRWPAEPWERLPELYPELHARTLLLWADEDERHPLALAEEALRRLPDAQLRVLDGTGFLIAYDDPVGVARELLAFCA